MRRSLFLLSLTLALAAPLAGPIFAQNQNEMNQKAEDDFKKADIELNRLYQLLTAKLDPSSKKELVQAQQAWIKYRDANARAHAAGFQGGSMYPCIYFGSRSQTTRERSREFKSWLGEFGK